MTLFALAAALPLCAGFAPTAGAGVNFDIYLGVPYYNEQIGPDYRYYDGRGWYRDRDFQDDRVYRGPEYRDRVYRDRISCNQARRLVRNSGYRNVTTRECSGRTYTFNATRKGRNVLVYVNSRTGSLRRG
ncbi:MAG: hypothetical protein ACKVP5_23140 [Aestuariivirga sp.]